MAQAQQQMSAAQANAAARALITSRAIKMTQNIYSNTVDLTANQTIQVPLRNVGLVLGWWIDLVLTTGVSGTANFALTDWGPANLLQQIVLTDLNNNVRIQTTGWHLNAVNSAKKRRPFGSTNTLTTYPINYGNNFTGVFAATAPTTGTGGSAKVRFWVPAAYSDYDLRGAMYMNVVNATAYLQMTFPTLAQAFPLSTAADATLGIAQGASTATAPTTGNVVVNVYQVYYDQLPVAGNNVVLPFTDLSTIYEIKNVTYTGMVTGQDFPIPYSNFRDFLSTFVIYDNGGTLGIGADVNYWALQSANFTNIFKVTPNLQALFSRNELGDDFPKGTYYFPTRDKPISTVQYGNMNLILNPTGTVNAGAQLLVGYEDFALVNTLVGAASIQTTA
jgi:hypothetical protein